MLHSFIHLQMAPNDIREQQKNVSAKSLFLLCDLWTV